MSYKKDCIEKVLVIIFIAVMSIFSFCTELSSQSTTEAWETITTKHFRIHYPVTYKDWTLHLASRIESMHDRVTAVVREEPEGYVDVLVIDPWARANGFAVPFLNRTRIVLFATPPTSGLSIGYMRSWSEELFTHEYVHVTHMIKKPRNRGERFLAKLVPIGPLVYKCPPWIIEGYATLLEGSLTGMGRPNGSFRAMFIREMAANGLMPTYGQLNGSDRWASQAFRYLYGSAFMEWLQEREGPECFNHLWRRLSAKKSREFDDAFKGVFMEPADELYGKFSVEMTKKALDIKTVIEEEALKEGVIWQKIYRNTGELSLSPDGKKLATVVYRKDNPPVLEIWSTTEDAVSEEKRKKQDEELIKKDPEDVPDKLSAPPKKKVLHKLKTKNGLPPFYPRFYPDGLKVLFHRYMPDRNGDLHPDLFQWNLKSGKVKRITHLANVRDAVPFDGGKKAIAIRSMYGKTQVVEVNIETGAIRELTKPSIDVIRSQPAVSPDNTRLALITHQDEKWTLEIYDINSFTLLRSLGSGIEIFTDPAWSSDGKKLYFVSDRTGIPNIEFVYPDTGEREMVTNVYSGAFSPAPDSSGKYLYYQRFWSKGISIYRVDMLVDDVIAADRKESGFFPLIPPASLPAVEPVDVNPPDNIRKYWFGPQQFYFSIGGEDTPSGNSFRLGIRMGDILKRNETELRGALSSNHGPKGATIIETLKLLPVKFSVRGFIAEEEPSKKIHRDQEMDDLLDYRVTGGAVSLSWNTRGDGYFFGASGTGIFSTKKLLRENIELSRNVGELASTFALYKGIDKVFFYTMLGGKYQLGSTENDGWSMGSGFITPGIAVGNAFALYGNYEMSELYGDYHPSDMFQVGGSPSWLLPQQAVSNRVIQPALEQGVMYGDAMERAKIAMVFGSAFTLYGEAVRAWDSSEEKPDPIRLIGLDCMLRMPPGGILNRFDLTPRFYFRLGIARIFDEPLLNKFKTYFSINYQP